MKTPVRATIMGIVGFFCLLFSIAMFFFCIRCIWFRCAGGVLRHTSSDEDDERDLSRQTQETSVELRREEYLRALLGVQSSTNYYTAVGVWVSGKKEGRNEQDGGPCELSLLLRWFLLYHLNAGSISPIFVMLWKICKKREKWNKKKQSFGIAFPSFW